MRILSGTYRNQRLDFPDKDVLRPTQEKVRAAVFNILQQDIQNCRFLDLCCGTGSMGIEALSRGAKFVHFVDLQTTLLTENLKNLKPAPDTSQWKMSTTSSTHFLSTLPPDSFDVIFFDPPWLERALYAEALEMIAQTQCLSPTGTLFIEHHRDHPPTEHLIATEESETSPQIAESPARRSSRKSTKYRLTRREIDAAQAQEIPGTYAIMSKKERHDLFPDDDKEGFGSSDEEGQWSPSAKQAPRQSERVPKKKTKRKKNTTLSSTNNALSERSFPLVVSHVYEYSDTHLTRMDYPR
jgi:16S rRNA (guanine(966)-N(2))-methyltransferase RsmD